MLKSTAEDLSIFLTELNRESDRGLALVGAVLIDEKLAETLKAFFRDGAPSKRLVDEPNSPLGTFSARTDACHALGLIDDFEFAEINLVRKIRNKFAHARHGLSFKDPVIRGLCSSLRSELPDDDQYPHTDPRFRFKNAVVILALRLYYRPLYVERDKCSPKTYLPEDEATWRSFKDDAPPEGVPFVAIGQISKKPP